MSRKGITPLKLLPLDVPASLIFADPGCSCRSGVSNEVGASFPQESHDLFWPQSMALCSVYFKIG